MPSRMDLIASAPMQLHVGQAGFENHVALEIENLLKLLEREIDHQTDATRQRLEEPDMRNRAGELDMAHTLAPHLGQRHLNATFLADNAAELHALVLAAQALIVFDRAKDAGAEQPVPLRLEGAVVDGLGLLDLAIRPAADLLWRGHLNFDLVEGHGLAGLTEDLHQFVHKSILPKGRK